MPGNGPTWDELYRRLPSEFLPYQLELAWDRRRLWSLALPIEELLVAELDWQLDLPWWRDGDRYFRVRPRDVLNDPVTYAAHYERMLAANLEFPISVIFRERRWFILDGVHRLLKAVVADLRSVEVRKVPEETLARIAVE